MGAAGHGGSLQANTPQILKPLRDKRITMIACGESHSMVLTDKGYLYVWGRGFEGQLGIAESIEIAATPTYVKHFHNKSVTSIAAGSFYSLAVDDQGSLYSWGEARMGQLGVGKAQCVRKPTQVHFPEEQPVQIKSCAAGFGHTLALTQHGDLYAWGFNCYGQVGVGNKKTVWEPTLVNQDTEGR